MRASVVRGFLFGFGEERVERRAIEEPTGKYHGSQLAYRRNVIQGVSVEEDHVGQFPLRHGAELVFAVQELDGRERRGS